MSEVRCEVRCLRKLLAAIAILVSFGWVPVNPACATTVTFEAEHGLSIPTDGSSFDDNGFRFVFGQIAGGFAEINDPPACAPPCTSNGTNAYYSFNSASLTMSTSGDTLFSLMSVDAAQTFAESSRALDLTIIGNIVGGGTIQDTLTTPVGGATTFATHALLGFDDLVSVEFVGGPTSPSSEFALDNIVGTISDVPVPMPEPSSSFMLAAALIGLAYNARLIRLKA